MPTDKAHGIQIAKMCEAFDSLGVKVTLVVPSRGEGSMRDVYGLGHDICVQRLPVINLQYFGALGYHLTVLQFIVGYFVFLWSKVLRGEQFLIYTVDMDGFSFGPLALIPRPVFAEMHSVKKSSVLVRHFFGKAGIIATNELISAALSDTFSIPNKRICVEPNGVDEDDVHRLMSKEEARKHLGLPIEESFALYVGRFYAWKGLEILSEAAPLSVLPIRVVGGDRTEYERVTHKSGDLLHFAGVQPLKEIPFWLAAADVLLILGTEKNQDSYRYTSPMKVFEYFAVRRPVVSSATPALKSLVSKDSVYWYEPDNSESFIRTIALAAKEGNIDRRLDIGYAQAEAHTWKRRAERILAFIRSADTLAG